MRVWKGGSTKTEEKQQDSHCFSNLTTASQLFAILIQLQLGLLITDVSNRFKIPESTYTVVRLPHGFVFIKRTSLDFSFSFM